jgi:hypothetical protein
VWDALPTAARLELDGNPLYERKGLKGLADGARADVERVCAALPDVDVALRWFVHDEDFIAERDTVTLEVTLTRHHVKEGAKAPTVHAPHFPANKKEEWWIVLKAEKPDLSPWVMMMEKVTDLSKVVKTELKFPAPPRAGDYKFTVHTICDSYLGLDHEDTFKLTVVSASLVEETVNEFDAAEDLSAETALETTFGAGNVDSDVSDSDSEDEDEDAPKSAKAKAAAAAKAKAKAAGTAAKGKAAGAGSPAAAKAGGGAGGSPKKGKRDDDDAVIVEAADADSDADAAEVD